jgi:nucleoredoxin
VSDTGRLEVIFVSSDRTPDDMISYMKESHGDWLAVELRSEAANNLQSKFKISGIPALIVCRQDGSVITTNGRGDVQASGPRALTLWK